MDAEDNPQYAYRLEEQMFAIENAQAQGKIWNQKFKFSNVTTVEEVCVRWHIINGQIRLSSFDCDEELLESLEEGQILINIYGPIEPHITFGRMEGMIAAILTPDYQPIYKSPLFNLESYLNSH